MSVGNAFMRALYQNEVTVRSAVRQPVVVGCGVSAHGIRWQGPGE
jgi:hypothetical protein